MDRWHPTILFFALAGGTGCQQMNRSETSAHDGFAKITLQIHGLMKAKSGATWMGWPDAVTASLEGINGTKQVVWDYARDLVTVSYDPGAAGPDVFAAVISELGYEAKPPPASAKKVRSTLPAQLRVPADAPQFFVDAIARARAAKQPLIIDFWAEWCGACLRLKRETLEHPDVANALRSVELIYVDLDKYPALGGVYGVAAIPDVIFADNTGRIVDRLQNFESPEAFVARFRKAFSQPMISDTTDR